MTHLSLSRTKHNKGKTIKHQKMVDCQNQSKKVKLRQLQSQVATSEIDTKKVLTKMIHHQSEVVKPVKAPNKYQNQKKHNSKLLQINPAQ